jgi:tRNA (guanine37-N1)-methyltransferase
MKICFLTLFPEEMERFFLKGLLRKAWEAKKFEVDFINIRDFANSKYKQVDDYPFGYRKGMILKVDVLYRAITSIKDYEDYRLIYMCPKGDIYNQKIAKEYANNKKGLILLSGYYEGVDERLFELFKIQRISLGDYVLNSGDMASLLVAESVLRLIPDVIGNPECVEEDSIVSGLLEAPQYTSPREFMEKKVPEVLLSGHHKNINNWRKKMSIKETWQKKPAMLLEYNLNKHEKEYLVEILKEEGEK